MSKSYSNARGPLKIPQVPLSLNRKAPVTSHTRPFHEGNPSNTSKTITRIIHYTVSFTVANFSYSTQRSNSTAPI